MKFFDQVTEVFEGYGFQISASYQVGDTKKYYIHMRECVLHIDEKDKSVDVSFNLNTLPDEVAKITLIINDLKYLKNISIMDSYFFNKNGELSSGIDAIKEFKRELYELEHTKTNLFEGMKCYNC